MKNIFTAIAKPFMFIKKVIWRAKLQDKIANSGTPLKKEK